MSEAIAVIAADAHLVERSWASRQIYGDSYYSFEQIVSLAIDLNVPLFVAGDILDHATNGSSPIVFLNQQMDRMASVKVQVWFSQGQHEFQDVPWLYSHNWPKHMHQRVIDVGPFKAYALDYQPAGKLQEALNTIPAGTDILFAHQVWAELAGEVCSPQGSFGDVPIVSTIFTGDLHKTQKLVTRGKDGQEISVYSPGSISMNAIDEPSVKYCFTLHADGTVSKQNIRTRPMIDWFVMNTPEDLERFTRDFETAYNRTSVAAASLPEQIRTPLLRITYSYRLTDAVQRVRQLVAGRAHLFFKELSPAPEQTLVAVDAVHGQATMESFLPDYLKARELTWLQPDCSRLLAAADVAAELQRMRSEALALTPTT